MMIMKFYLCKPLLLLLFHFYEYKLIQSVLVLDANRQHLMCILILFVYLSILPHMLTINYYMLDKMWLIMLDSEVER